jgi:hypothetical protein
VVSSLLYTEQVFCRTRGNPTPQSPESGLILKLILKCIASKNNSRTLSQTPGASHLRPVESVVQDDRRSVLDHRRELRTVRCPRHCHVAPCDRRRQDLGRCVLPRRVVYAQVALRSRGNQLGPRAEEELQEGDGRKSLRTRFLTKEGFQRRRSINHLILQAAFTLLHRSC